MSIGMCVPHVAVCCSVLQCVAVCCSVLQCVAMCDCRCASAGVCGAHFSIDRALFGAGSQQV